ncbi:hypothetical protein Q7P37_002017 [Cladosporium fusiforme]
MERQRRHGQECIEADISSLHAGSGHLSEHPGNQSIVGPAEPTMQRMDNGDFGSDTTTPHPSYTANTTPNQSRRSLSSSKLASDPTLPGNDHNFEALPQLSSHQQNLNAPQLPDLEAQIDPASLQHAPSELRPSVSLGSEGLSRRTSRHETDRSSHRGSEDDEDEQMALYDFSEELRSERPVAEPWILEMSRLRRIYILWLNKRLSLCRRTILEHQRVSDEDMRNLGDVLRLQAEAIRDLQSIRALDVLTQGEKEKRGAQMAAYFKSTAATKFTDVDPFDTENYRRIRTEKQAVLLDGVREMLRTYLPKWISWSREEKTSRKELYEEGTWKPEKLSNAADRLARFIVAMGGALFILVPMYIMALDQNPTKNLITTTVAVMLFAFVCSIPLKLANDQIFSATVGYAAVLMVFVGLTSAPS